MGGIVLGVAVFAGMPASVVGQTLNPSAANPERDLPAIKQYVGKFVKQLTGEDRQASADARRELIKPTDPTANPSAGFMTAYSIAISQQLKPAVDHPDALVRLNAALVIESLARRGAGGPFEPLIVQLIGDSSAGLAVWGLRAGAWLLPDQLTAAGGPGALVQAVANVPLLLPESAPAIEEAYDALAKRLGDAEFARGLGARRGALFSAVAGELQGLLTSRLSIDTTGSRVSPMSDERALRFLLTSGWNETSPEQQTRSIELANQTLLVALERLKQQRAAAVDATENIELIKKVGTSLQVTALQTKDSQLGNVAAIVSRLSRAQTDQAFVNAINSLSAALGKSFPNAKLTPPKVGPLGEVESVEETPAEASPGAAPAGGMN
jgi:hypothetical protein